MSGIAEEVAEWFERNAVTGQVDGQRSYATRIEFGLQG